MRQVLEKDFLIITPTELQAENRDLTSGFSLIVVDLAFIVW
jgi:hypothetical protein